MISRSALTPNTETIEGPATRAANRFRVLATIVPIVSWISLIALLHLVWPVLGGSLGWSLAAVTAMLIATGAYATAIISGAVLYFTSVFVCGSLLFVTAIPGQEKPSLLASIGWSCVIGIVAGLALDRTSWRRTLIATSAALFGLLLGVELYTGEFGTRFVVSIPLATLTYGMIAGRMIDTVLMVGRRDDEAAAKALEAAAAASAADARADESFRLSRMLHDGVVNTLGAIRWAFDVDLDALRSRCARDVAAIESASPTAKVAGVVPLDLPELISRATSSARMCGISLEVQRSGNVPAVPMEVLGAISGALDEAILNAQKHGRARSATLCVAADDTQLRIIFHDHGRGFPEDVTLPADGGVARSIILRCARANVAVARQLSAPGTRYDFTWKDRISVDESGGERELDRKLKSNYFALRAAMTMVALETALWLMTRLIVDLPFDWGLASAWWWIGMLTLIGSGVAIGILGATRRSALRWWQCSAMVAMVAVIAAIPSPSVESCIEPGVGVWQSMGAFIVASTLMWLTPGYRWTVAAGVAFVVGWGIALALSHVSYGCSNEQAIFLVLNSLALAILWGLRRFLETLGRGAQESIEAAVKSRTAEVETLSREAVRQQVEDLALAAGIPLLRDIAEGRRDPMAPDVRREAELVESLLRNCAYLEVGLEPVASVLLRSCQHAASRGVVVRLSYVEPPPISEEQLAELERILISAMDAAVSHSEVIVTALASGEQGSVTCYLVIGEPIELAEVVSGLSVLVHTEDSARLIEVTWNQVPHQTDSPAPAWSL